MKPERIVGDYAASIRGKDGTRYMYGLVAREFAEWCGENDFPFPDVSPGELLVYRQHLRRSRGHKESTVAGRFRALAHFYRWAIAAGIVTTSPLDRIDIPTIEVRPRQAVSIEELRRLWGAARGPERRAMIGLLGLMGLPVEDVVALDVTDVVQGLPYSSLKLKSRPGSRAEVQALIPTQVMEAITEATAGRRSGPLLVTQSGARLSRNAIFGRMRTIVGAAEIERRISPSTLTYTLRGLALEHGFSYLGTIAATGELGASHGRRWTVTRLARPEQHAAIRLSHLVFGEPGSSMGMLFEASVALAESALPPAIAIMTAGAALERHLRELARASNIRFDKEESKLQMSAYVARLAGARVVSKADHKVLLALEDHRNTAAHGWFELASHTDAEWMLTECRAMMTKYPVPTTGGS